MYFDAPFFLNIYYHHVRNAVLDVCAKSVPIWGKRGEMRGLLRGETLSLTCPFLSAQGPNFIYSQSQFFHFSALGCQK